MLRYDPETGSFTWIVTKSAQRAGARAGGVDRHGYRRLQIDGAQYLEHRLAFLYMTGAFPPDEVDHINRDRSDNRWENLRPADRIQNQGNVALLRSNTSGSRGVVFHKKTGKWQAQITLHQKRKYIGLYDTVSEAAEAYATEALKHFGSDFAPSLIGGAR